MGQTTSSRCPNRSSSQSRSSKPLPYQHVLITGASSGIGAAVACRLAATTPGIRLTLVARNASRLDAVAAACRAAGAAEVQPLLVDVCDRPAMAAALGQIAGPIDLVLANAGTAVAAAARAISGSSEDNLPDALWMAANTNIMGTLNAITPVLPQLRAVARAGRPAAVAIMSSVSALPPKSVQFTGQLQLGLLPYAWTKQCLLLLGEGLQAELASSGISVYTICPGVVLTELAVNLALNLRAAPPTTAAPSIAGAVPCPNGSIGTITPTTQPPARHVAPKPQDNTTEFVCLLSPDYAIASTPTDNTTESSQTGSQTGNQRLVAERLGVLTNVDDTEGGCEDHRPADDSNISSISSNAKEQAELPAAAAEAAVTAATVPARSAADGGSLVRNASAENELRQRLNAITPEEAAEFICNGLMRPAKQGSGLVAFPPAAVRVMKVMSLLPQKLLVKAIKNKL